MNTGTTSLENALWGLWIPENMAGLFQKLWPGGRSVLTGADRASAGLVGGRLFGDSVPGSPGIYRFGANPARSPKGKSRAEVRPALAVFGPWHGAQVASPRCPILQPGRGASCPGFQESPAVALTLAVELFQELVNQERSRPDRHHGCGCARSDLPARCAYHAPGCGRGWPRRDGGRAAPRPTRAAACWW